MQTSAEGPLNPPPPSLVNEDHVLPLTTVMNCSFQIHHIRSQKQLRSQNKGGDCTDISRPDPPLMKHSSYLQIPDPHIKVFPSLVLRGPSVPERWRS